MEPRYSASPFAGLVRFLAAPFRLGFIPLLTAAAPLISGLMGGAGGGGGGGSPAPAPVPAGPIENKASFGPVTFGAKYLGDSAVKQAPAIIAAEDKSLGKYIPWAVGGVVALVALVLVLPAFLRRRKGD